MLFWLYWVGMLILAAVGLSTGDPMRLIRPIDYRANPCGDDSVGLGSTPVLYYPRLAQDAFSLYQDGSDGDPECADTAAGCFYGVCVAACPAVGDIVCTVRSFKLYCHVRCNRDIGC